MKENKTNMKNKKNKILKKMTNPEFKCDICHLIFVRKFTLKRHMKHHGNKISRHICNICKNTFSTKDSLKNHSLRAHKKLPNPSDYLKTVLEKTKCEN